MSNQLKYVLVVDQGPVYGLTIEDLKDLTILNAGPER